MVKDSVDIFLPRVELELLMSKFSEPIEIVIIALIREKCILDTSQASSVVAVE
jgi:hypothetical protein